ncbi:hypothetical protein L249_2737 [Ophiocordyceps polyrhachis-furcata BCC 54312]|uniref:N-acetylglucosamine-6-phosphate deacetylase n=1 Tax=Ophiocordyceps polyrhachis-furcata BCC 54312 TaxID=1330021 RepID=A0A367LNG1_9HYPO|nr:hypothetical protein L249_2737 [Ophiocordyceps polyrhachis-furcata BCC 54312]
MPIALSPPRSGLTKLTNCRLVKGDRLVDEDLWVSSATGTIIDSQASFYDDLSQPDETLDLGGRIVAPGMIDCQLNGAFGFNLSTLLDDMSQYGKKVRELNRLLVTKGVTSYLPTITSQRPEVYQKALPYLGPSGSRRMSGEGAESLGAHCEGPFLNPTKNGIHDVDSLIVAESFADIEACYGYDNVNGPKPPVRLVTAAPERGRMSDLIHDLTSRGIIFSVGHSEATYEDASEAVAQGATMITHLFNAMRPLHHRDPGIFGVLGQAESRPRPYYGVIADGIHLHPTTVKIAFNAHPEGFILVTDAMHVAGLPDGTYPWTNGGQTSSIVKTGAQVLLENSRTIAGSMTTTSSITLLECVNNFLSWTGATIPQALRAVTATPAAMLGLQGIKGTLEPGADADLVVLSEVDGKLELDEVWKFGRTVRA